MVSNDWNELAFYPGSLLGLALLVVVFTRS
jgi:hypothetical protein